MKETKKQLDYINFIEDQTGVPYIGETKEEASKYISENEDKIPKEAFINTWSIINDY